VAFHFDGLIRTSSLRMTGQSRFKHPNLAKAASAWFDKPQHVQALPAHKSVGKDHGRIETREVFVSTQLGWLDKRGDWANLNAVAMVQSTRQVGNKFSCERRLRLEFIERHGTTGAGHTQSLGY
jgi:hypothetical protein